MRLTTRLLKYCGTALLGAAATSCSSPGKVTSTPQADIMVLSPDYSIAANRGPGPISIESQANLERFQFFRPGLPEEYLLVLFPENLDGDLAITLSDGSRQAVTSTYGTYFDLLLRAHRMLLSGDLMGAEKTIERIEATYDEGYGTAVLKANLAVIRGDADAASRHFEVANQLLPGNEALSKLVPPEKGEGN